MSSLNKIFTVSVLLLSTTALSIPSSAQDASALDQQMLLQAAPEPSDLTLDQPSATSEQVQTQAQAQTQTAPSQTAIAPTQNPTASQSILANAGAQEIPPIPSQPGLDLPINENLAEAEEKSPAQKAAEMRHEAFGAATQGLMPMRTEEIRKLLELYDETQQAVQTPIYPNPKPESTFQQISLQPGTPPVELKTALGHVSTLSIVDATGQPWPIQDISWAGNFEVLQPESGSNMLRITPMADYAFGNVSMRLIGLNAPVILTLRTERKSVQVRADLQIPEIGPNGVAAPIERQITTTAGDQKLTTILEGVAPSAATRIRISGIDGRTSAYDVDGVTYVRTPYTLLSPAWDSSVRSADGTNVYAMKFTPVLLLSDKGKMVRAQLEKVVSDEQ